ncbi:MAG: hypothetical protein H0T89_26140 [Deltaproteobacteria bacterium]|nr:hypothetical protein [Deltaproteobacteria bacterium]MDQ3299340.1 hypothetical protein [Myxococcota bacterium]
MKRALVLAWLTYFGAAIPAVAHADDKTRAMALFDEGIKELKAGNYEKACKSLAASNALVPDSGTRGSLARCYTQLGKIASAWRLWRELADTAPVALRADASANAKKLEPRLPRYVIRLAPGAASLARSVAVTLDGVAIDPSIDVPVPIDPGTYTLEANAAGYADWTFKLVAVEGKTEEIVIPALKPIVAKPPVETPAPAVTTDDSKRRRRHVLGLSVAGGGAAVVVVGGVFGMIARGRYDDAKSACGGDIERCDPTMIGDAQAKVDSARSAGNLATVLTLVGGAAIVTGIVLYVTAPDEMPRERRVSIAPAIHGDGAGLVISGGF